MGNKFKIQSISPANLNMDPNHKRNRNERVNSFSPKPIKIKDSSKKTIFFSPTRNKNNFPQNSKSPITSFGNMTGINDKLNESKMFSSQYKQSLDSSQFNNRVNESINRIFISTHIKPNFKDSSSTINSFMPTSSNNIPKIQQSL